MKRDLHIVPTALVIGAIITVISASNTMAGGQDSSTYITLQTTANGETYYASMDGADLPWCQFPVGQEITGASVFEVEETADGSLILKTASTGKVFPDDTAVWSCEAAEKGTYLVRAGARENDPFATPDAGGMTLWQLTPAVPDIAWADIRLDEIPAYNGEEQQPAITVTLAGEPLQEGNDYVVDYGDYMEAGEAAMTVIGVGRYAGLKDIAYEIAPADIKDTEAEITDVAFTGDFTAPDIFLHADSGELVEGRDYTVRFDGGYMPGEARATIHGTGNYCGERELTYEVTGGLRKGDPLADACSFVKGEDISAAALTVPEDIHAPLTYEPYTGSEDQRFIAVGEGKRRHLYAEAQSMYLLAKDNNLYLTDDESAATEFILAGDAESAEWDIQTPGRTWIDDGFVVEQETLATYNGAYRLTANGWGLAEREDAAVLALKGDRLAVKYSGDGLYRLEDADGKSLYRDGDAYRFGSYDGTEGYKWEVADTNGRLSISRDGDTLTLPASMGGQIYAVTAEQFIAQVGAVAEMARVNGFTYGNSSSAVPCADGLIACDRLASRSLYDIGFTDQRPGGEIVESLIPYMQAKGAVTVTDQSAVTRGDIVIMADAAGHPDHAFVVADYDPGSGIVVKYDTGEDWRIRSVQPFTTAFNEWPGRRQFLCALRFPANEGTTFSLAADEGEALTLQPAA